MDEISVLDYLKFKLNPKNRGKELLPDSVVFETEEPFIPIPSEPTRLEKLAAGIRHICGNSPAISAPMPILTFAGVLLAIFAQFFLEPLIIGAPHRLPLIAAGLYILSALCFIYAYISAKQQLSEDRETPIPESASVKLFCETIRYDWLVVSLVFALLAFLFFGGNRFTFLNLALWIASLIFAFAAFAEIPSGENFFEHLRKKISALPHKVMDTLNGFTIHLNGWNLLCITVFALGVFFRFYRLNEVPLDMFSDQAEKLYDVMDVLEGKHAIYFTRNTGREAFQFYLTALVIRLFGTGISFLSLKIGTAIAGIFILPFVYFLGKKFGNRWVGLFAMLFTGIAYWPNVIGRVALRFAFYPMFTAPALWFLYRGLSNRSRKDLIACGIFLGLGLHGYSPFRIVPIAALIIFLIFLFSDVAKPDRKNALSAFLVLVLFAFLVFLPLARVTCDMPEMVAYRSISRLGQTETSFEESPVKIFFVNLWKALVMPFWENGETWVHSIVYRPALDHLSASFYFIGLVLFILRFVQSRRWEDIALLISVPVLMLPSILSLAFPRENPCLNRTGGALILIMIITAFGFCFCFENILDGLRNHTAGTILTALAALILAANICGHNYELVFKQYNYNYTQNAWNTAQIGSVIRGFAESIGEYEDAYVIPNAHWVDTRLVGINAGDPHRDYALDKTLLETLSPTDHPRLFIYRPSDTETREILHRLWPKGLEQLYYGPYDSKNFYAYTVFDSGE